MEKITLKPAVKELIYKSSEPGLCFDVLSHAGASVQEKNLGSLYVLSQLKQKEEDLDYLISLTSSLAKREYYSQESLIEQNPKAAFERALKKLNEVLDDFFKNKNLTLNLGLAAIAGDTIYISRLGKFKVALARKGEYIDILNNIQLFNKDDGDEKQFANIISGKLQAGDKIFAYFPHRGIASRERLLNPIFISQGQEEFSQKIAQLAANANNFFCCGIHILIKEIKEIPVQAMTSSYQSAPNQVLVPEPEANEQTGLKPAMGSQSKDKPDHESPSAGSNVPNAVIRAEVSVTKRSNILAAALAKLGQIIPRNRFNHPPLADINEPKPIKIADASRISRLRFFIIAAVIVIFPIFSWTIIKNSGSSQEATDAFKIASRNLELARSRLAQNDPREARNLLHSALAQIAELESKQIDITRSDINKTLDSIDNVSDKQPELLYNSSGKDLQFKKVAVFGNAVGITDGSNRLFSINLAEPTPSDESKTGEPAESGQFKKPAKSIFGAKDYIASFDGTSAFEVYDPKTKKIAGHSLNNEIEFQDTAIYENNLYALTNGKIEKYPDVITGGVKGNNWGEVSDSGVTIALTVDGNVYVLNTDGKISRYFKGKKEFEFDLKMKPLVGTVIKADKNSPFIYLADNNSRKVFVFDKESGSLKTSYKLDIAGDIQDISITPEGRILILSKTNNIWQIRP